MFGEHTEQFSRLELLRVAASSNITLQPTVKKLRYLPSAELTFDVTYPHFALRSL